MNRDIYKQLIQWKLNGSRKPLILNGARQIGKTYILRKFGEAEFEKVAFFSLDRDLKVRSIFVRSMKENTIV